MKAHYGYKDGAGDFFIIIDTDKCVACPDHACAPACPEGVLEIIEDDYDDRVAAVVADHRMGANIMHIVALILKLHLRFERNVGAGFSSDALEEIR